MVLAFASIFSGCHFGSNSANSSGTPIVSRGVIKNGGVIVNGVTFDVSGAQITFNGSPGIEAQLQEGVTVKIKGGLNSDEETGTAEKIVAWSDIAGPVAVKEGDSITIFGQQIFVDSRTIFANTSFQAVTVGQSLEVFGIRDTKDRFLATRVVLEDINRCVVGSDNIPNCVPIIPDLHLTGVIEAPLSPGNPPFLSFKLGDLTVSTDPTATIVPAGATINLGDPVRISEIAENLTPLSSTTITVGFIERVDLEDAELEPQENEQFEVEGFVSNFTTLNADFTVNGITTRLTGTARFEGGVAEDLVNNVMVRAEGHMLSGVLQADKIKFDDPVRIEANADVAGSASVLGKTVITTGMTDLENLTGGILSITQGQGLKIRGFANPDGTITATRLVGLGSPLDANKIVIQGVVESYSASDRTVVVLGITTNASGAAEVQLDEQPIPLDQFFSQLTSGKTIVKARGEFSVGPSPLLAADKVAIE
jgi:uncharacterized protein DUF5666